MVLDPAALEPRENARFRWRQNDAIDVRTRCCGTNGGPRRSDSNLRGIGDVCGAQDCFERLKPAARGLADQLFGPLPGNKDSDHARDARLDSREEMDMQTRIPGFTSS